jgi:hypothetical protein
LIVMLESEGCEVKPHRRGGHARVRVPGVGGVLHLALTPSKGRRSLLNTVAQFRRLGLKLIRE